MVRLLHFFFSFLSCLFQKATYILSNAVNISQNKMIFDLFSFDFLVSTVSVEAVLGRSTSLPCDIEPEVRDDRVYMVLWFREKAGKPLYK